jgi:hypothetical protein
MLLATSMVGCAARYPHSSPEQLGKSVFKMLKKQEAEALAALVPLKSDLEAFLATADMPDEERKMFEQEIDKIIEDYQGMSYLAYTTASDVASLKGIVLSKAKLEGIRSKSWDGMDNALASIELKMSQGGEVFYVHIIEAGKVESGWVLGQDAFKITDSPLDL